MTNLSLMLIELESNVN